MPNLHEIILALRSPGTYPILNTIRYALSKDRLNRKAAQPKPGAPQILPGRLIKSTRIPQGSFFEFEYAQLELIFLASDLVRISWTSTRGEAPPLPYAIAKTDWPPLEIGWHSSEKSVVLSSSTLDVTVFLDGKIKYSIRDGVPLRIEAPPTHTGQCWTSQTKLCKEEAVFGLGEHTGEFNLRGQSHKFWNTDPGGKYGKSTDPIYMPIPIYLGIHDHGSYLIFYENYHRGDLKIDPTGSNEHPCATIQFEGGMLRHYFIPGPPSRAIERYTQLTGRPGMPPRWSLGYHQSRWGYKEERDIGEVIAGFKEHKLPLSAIHLDIDYMEGYRVFTVNRDRFPNFSGMIQELDKAGVKTVTIIDPGVKKDPEFEVYREGIHQEAFCRLPHGKIFTGLVWAGWTVYPDFTDPKTRHWWGKYYQRLLDAGVAGIWHDMNEPCSFSAWGGLEIPDVVRHHLEGQGGDHVAAHNIYALQMNRAGYEAMQRFRPDQRPWLVSRSGWAGQQRYAWNWTGDTESTWDGLKLTISTVLSLGLSGFPYSGPDIGGFSGDPSQELYLRWFQLAAFLPFFRTHSAAGTPRREPWIFGEPYTEIARKFLDLRYKMMPCWYTLAWEAMQTGHPIIRPCFWYDEAGTSLQTSTLNLADTFYLGSALLIAPIVEKGCLSRRVSLPTGIWYGFWDDTSYKGPAVVQIPAQLDQIPVFVKAGSLIPLQEGETLNLHIYLFPPGDSADSKDEFIYELYTDAGDGYGAWRIDEFRVEQESGQLFLHWNSRGEFPFPYQRVEIILHGADATKAVVDDQETPIVNRSFFVSKFKNAHFTISGI